MDFSEPDAITGRTLLRMDAQPKPQSKIENRKSNMMPSLSIIAAVILTSAAVALSLRNLIHSALVLIVTWLGVSAFYLWAGAEFVGFAQILLYVGAISMVVLFAVLLTRRSMDEARVQPSSLRRVIAAVLAGGALAGVLAGAVLSTRFLPGAGRPPEINVRQIGLQLMGPHAASLLLVGVLLTVALIGATVIASSFERDDVSSDPDTRARSRGRLPSNSGDSHV